MRVGLAVIGLLASIATAIPIASADAGTVTFGSSLSATPTLDTANGAYSHTGYAGGTERAVAPFPHFAEDTAVWNSALASGHAAAAVGGQVSAVEVKGCAIKDTTAPTQKSQGIAVNTILFQTLAPSGAGWQVADTAGAFLLPFCSDSAHPAKGRVSTGTVSVFRPLHECLAPGDTVALHDIGGFIGQSNGRGPWYPQGVPLDVIASVGGSNMASYIGGGGTFGPSGPSGPEYGFSREAHEEVTMRIVEGTGLDAYGLCPGGHANEPVKSDRIICDYGTSGDGHGECDRYGRPIPSTIPPRISGLRLSRTAFGAGAAVTVRYRDNRRSTTVVRVLTAAGRAVRTAHRRDRAGLNSAAVPDSGLAPGAYTLTVQAATHGHTSISLQRSFRITGA
jgi:hypothetical protein